MSTGERVGAGSLGALTRMMTRLRAAPRPADLLATAPREVVDLGFDRCLLSRVDTGHWIAQSSHVRDDAALARALTRAGSEAPAVLDRTLLETELLRRPVPLVVLDAQRNPRVHRRLIDVSASTAYVVAPLRVDGDVVGLLHADRTTDTVDRTDAELLGLVAECLGEALEAALGRQRLAAVHASLAPWSSSTLALLDRIDGPRTPSPTPLPAPRPATPPGTLTDREHEVIERIAAGEGNAAIARALHITEATVKAHVKHIFRKLDVANRAEAVSTWLRR